MNYLVHVADSAKQELAAIPQPYRGQIGKKLRLVLEDPYHGVKKLEGYDFWRWRSGDYRMIGSIDDKNNVVQILFIRHRKDVYRKLV